MKLAKIIIYIPPSFYTFLNTMNIIHLISIKRLVLQQVWFDEYRAIQSIQDKAWIEGNGYSLVKTHNAGLEALGCSLWTSQKTVIHVVALFVKRITIPCKARLEANRFLTRCTHQTKLVEILPYNEDI